MKAETVGRRSFLILIYDCLLFFTRRNEEEDFSLLGAFLTHMFRVPLHTYAKRMVLKLNCLRESVLALSRNNKALAYLIYCLMVHTVDIYFVTFQNAVKHRIFVDGNRVNTARS